MPELPEVETIRRDLAPALVGRSIRRVRIHKPDIVLAPDTPARFRRAVRGARIVAVERRAKYLLIRLSDGSLIQTQLRMSGRFAFRGQLADPKEFRHIAAEFELDDGSTLLYDDVRRLGGFRLLTDEAWMETEARLGPEPLERGFTARKLAAALEGSRAPVKNALLDQRRIAGIGNIYASEALFRAGIDPRRPAGGLSQAELASLTRAIRGTLRAAIRSAGTTFQNYRAVNGRSGSFQEALAVYGREGESCRRCATPIERIVQAGRGTFSCPGCQH